MWDFKLLAATRAIEKNMMLTLYRFSICFAIACAFIVAIVAGAGTGLAVGSFSDSLAGFGHFGGALGFLGCAVLIYWARNAFLFSVRSAHLAGVVEQMDERALPGGSKQIAHAQRIVQKRFEKASLLAQLDQSIKQVLGDVFDAESGVSTRIPAIPHARIEQAVKALLALPVASTDAVVLGYQLRASEKTVWTAAQEALVLYGERFRELFKNALILFVLVYVGWFLVYLVMLEPVSWVEGLLPESIGGWRHVLALLLAWAIAAGFFQPIAEASMIALFFNLTQGQQPSAAVEERMSEYSSSFQAIKERAQHELPQPSTQAEPSTES